MLQTLSLSLHIFSPSLPHHRRHHHHHKSPPLSHTFLHRPTSHFSLSALPSPRSDSWPFAQLSEQPSTSTTITPTIEEEAGSGPVELPSSTLFATTDDPTPLQVATSVLLTGAISVFLFRSVRRRIKRAKELKFRSSGVKKTLQQEALESLKTVDLVSSEIQKTPSPVQAFLGAIVAGVIALILYKFTTTIEAALNRQTISDNFSVRQLTITIRTIVNGLCYLATFVFGFNSLGLFLYSGQLAINSFMGGGETVNADNGKSDSLNSTSEGSTDSAESRSSQGDQSTDNTQ